MSYKFDRKTFLCIIFHWFSLRFREITTVTIQKTFSFLAAFFAVLLLREKQKKPFVSPFFFLHTLYLDKKKIQRNVFLSICSSHAKNQANPSQNIKQPKIRHRPDIYASGPSILL